MARHRLHILRHLHGKYRAKIPSPTVLLFTAVFILFFSFVIVSFTRLNTPSWSPIRPQQAVTAEYPLSVTIWSPRASCSGTFTSATAELSDPPFPAAVIREAVVDRRYLSMKQFRDVHPSIPFMRIILYMSVHLSISLTREDAVAQLLVQNTTSSSLRANVDFVTRVDPFLFLGAYKPGKKTKRGNQVGEWQVAVSITPAEKHSDWTPLQFMHQVAKFADEHGARLSLALPLKRFGGFIERFDAAFDLACVTDWESPSVYPPIEKLHQQPKCYAGARSASGALLVSGSALYGNKKTDPNHYREVAHFAARALQGPSRFETVAMSIVVNNSCSDRNLACGRNKECHSVMQKRNHELLRNVRKVVEGVFEELELDRSLWHKLILVPYGRLGSDANGTEVNDPGRSSHRYGQYHATFFTYAMLSPFFKWSMSYDMDEFIADTPSSRTFSPKNVEDVLDQWKIIPHGHAFFPWLNFRVPSNTSNRLTQDVMSGKVPVLDGGKGCYKRGRDITGKSAVRCDVGLGFTIHRPVIKEKSSDPTELRQIQGQRVNKNLRTWHARLGHSRGKCAFSPKE